MLQIRKLDDVIHVSEWGKLTLDLWKKDNINILVLDLSQVDKSYKSIIKTQWSDGSADVTQALNSLMDATKSVMNCKHEMVPGAGGDGRAKCKYCILETL